MPLAGAELWHRRWLVDNVHAVQRSVYPRRAILYPNINAGCFNVFQQLAMPSGDMFPAKKLLI